MDILFCFDKKYEQHFGVAVTSLILNNIDNVIRIHLVTKKPSSNLREKIDQITLKYNVEFLIYEIDETEIKNLTVSAHISSAAYYRLLAPDLLPKDLDKVLYLDSDLIVNGSLLELYNLNILNYLVAARGGKVVTQKKRLDLKSNYYFNSGVMLINLEAWHQMDIGNQCIQFLKENPHMTKLWDQDALNKVIDGQFLNLDKKWNSLVDLYEGTSEVNNQSVIVHFVGSLKPWHNWCINSDKEIYWSYLRQSPWSNSVPEIPYKPKAVLSAIKSILKQLQNSRRQLKNK
jgi:lipopolysaccharide biosynthesis glycosyltransferase